MYKILAKCLCINEEIKINDDINMFENCTGDNVPWLSLNGITCQCKVVDVYDADTVTIVLPFNNELYRVKCRLLGIDITEKRTKNLDEKKVALEATEWLSVLIKDKVIWVKCGNWGKYGGRMLGTLYMSEDEMEQDRSINLQIVDKGFAYAYDGKKKRKFEDWYNKKILYNKWVDHKVMNINQNIIQKNTLNGDLVKIFTEFTRMLFIGEEKE